jgi:hypothetical protein
MCPTSEISDGRVHRHLAFDLCGENRITFPKKGQWLNVKGQKHIHQHLDKNVKDAIGK